jgi:hypothetical protein
MSLIEPKGRPYKVCGKCRTCIILPDSISEEDKHKVADLCHADQRMEAIRHLRMSCLPDLREAKAIVIHVTGAKGICHRCRSPLKGNETCPKCKSLNLDW